MLGWVPMYSSEPALLPWSRRERQHSCRERASNGWCGVHRMKVRAEQASPAQGTNGSRTVPNEAPYRSPAERRAEGKSLRDAVPRDEHSGWRPPKERRDPVEIVLAGNEGRLPELLPKDPKQAP